MRECVIKRTVRFSVYFDDVVGVVVVIVVDVSIARLTVSVTAMPLSIGVNLRVTGHCNQGGRKYMEDMFCVAFQPTPDDKDLEYAFFGIFDGHGGGEAATFAKEHLMDIIVKQKNFWSDRDEDVLRAIRDGYMNTHYAMWRELGTAVHDYVCVCVCMGGCSLARATIA